MRVKVIGGVYRGRTGTVVNPGDYFMGVKPDQSNVGGLTPSGCMVVGTSSQECIAE